MSVSEESVDVVTDSGSQNIQSILLRLDLLKGSINRILSFAEKIPDNTNTDLIETRLNRLDEVWKEFTNYTEELYGFKNEKDYVDPKDDYYEYEDLYMSAQCLLKSAQSKQTDSKKIVDKQAVLIEQLLDRLQKLESSGNSRRPSREENDFPKIVIKPFDGNYNEWPSFETLFTSALETKPEWTNIQKLKYLKTLLRGDAAKAIQDIQDSEKSFDIAWKSLKQTFHRPRFIANTYIQQFMNIPVMKKPNSNDIRNICGIAGDVLRALDSIGETDRDPWLIYILLSRLHSDLHPKWIEHSSKDLKPTLASFLIFLDEFSNDLDSGKDYYCPKGKGTPRRSSSVQSLQRTTTLSNSQGNREEPTTTNNVSRNQGNRRQFNRRRYNNQSNNNSQASTSQSQGVTQMNSSKQQPNTTNHVNPFRVMPI